MRRDGKYRQPFLDDGLSFPLALGLLLVLELPLGRIVHYYKDTAGWFSRPTFGKKLTFPVSINGTFCIWGRCS
jgi:hypothetical protein